MEECLDKARACLNIIPGELISQIENFRYSLRHSNFAHLQEQGPSVKVTANAPSSDEESEEEVSFPSITKVADTILDSSLIEISNSYIPNSYQRPALVLTPLDSKLMDWVYVHSALMDLGISPVRVQVVQFFANPGFVHSAVVWLQTLSEAEKAYMKLRRMEDQNSLPASLYRIPGVINSISVRWFNYKAVHPRANWHALVLRGLDPNCEDLKRVIGATPLRTEPPRLINGVLCTIAVVSSAKKVEKICQKHLINKKKGGVSVKIDMHPLSQVCNRPEFAKYESPPSPPVFIENHCYQDWEAKPYHINSYVLYELPGKSFGKSEEFSHSGIYILNDLAIDA